ncbi:bifunctional 4-hydroxy-3-methylbut-2-enyl diphosphate reductase/30S ribosomal protein S1 [Caloramator australicus]|nr:bifunctional 4-hydroxy-3-methylbut-2-enyl diphosphate reductase/30S ribosomal protein S1 [Caloramator australicus]
MMEILLAKNAGFCFGVKNAMEKALKASEEEKNVKTLGPIIHNPDAVRLLEEKGVCSLNSVEDVGEDDTIIIRSHGIGKGEYEILKSKAMKVIDATCPYVKNIHNIVEKNFKNGYKIVIIGDSEHPEVKGINGWCDNEAIIIKDIDGVVEDNFKNQRVCVVSQTTFNAKKWHEIACKIIALTKEALIINTICSATEIRQKETEDISKKVDLMIVIGGKNSSNTRKLYEISKENCNNVMLIENANELNIEKIKQFNKIGITAGASTPQFVIEEVMNNLVSISNEDKITNDVFEKNKLETKIEDSNDMDLDYFSDFIKIEVGDVVMGKVLHVTDEEVYFDIGYKSDGILPKEEASNLQINLKEKFKIGEEYEVEIIKLNDGEGNVLLSRRSLEKEEFIENLKNYKHDGTLVDIEVIRVIKGGFECKIGELRCFMPLSHSGIDLVKDNPEDLVGKKLKANVLEVKEDGKIEIIVSRREVARHERQQRSRNIILNLQEGMTQRGKVKTIIDSGVFVDTGDYDAFIPVSELSWKRIQKPSDVIKIGDIVEFIIIKLDKALGKVTGSIKRTMETPWEKFIKKYSVEDIVEGKIVAFAEFGAFVELEEGVQGLVHISNMSHIRINKPQDIAKIGQKVKVKIIDIDYENKRISLSIKDAKNSR